MHNRKNLRYFLLLFYLFRQIFCQNYQLVFFYQYFKWPIIYSLYKGVQHSTNRFFSLQGKSLRESVENAFNNGSYKFSECFLHFCQLNFFPRTLNRQLSRLKKWYEIFPVLLDEPEYQNYQEIKKCHSLKFFALLSQFFETLGTEFFPSKLESIAEMMQNAECLLIRTTLLSSIGLLIGGRKSQVSDK